MILRSQIDKLPSFWCYKQTNYQGSDVTSRPINKSLTLQIDQLSRLWFYKYTNYKMYHGSEVTIN